MKKCKRQVYASGFKERSLTTDVMPSLSVRMARPSNMATNHAKAALRVKQAAKDVRIKQMYEIMAYHGKSQLAVLYDVSEQLFVI